jgi:hypothetical protein
MGAMAKKMGRICVGSVERKTIRATLFEADLFTYYARRWPKKNPQTPTFSSSPLRQCAEYCTEMEALVHFLGCEERRDSRTFCLH